MGATAEERDVLVDLCTEQFLRVYVAVFEKSKSARANLSTAQAATIALDIVANSNGFSNSRPSMPTA